jgi:hypothetical protein
MGANHLTKVALNIQHSSKLELQESDSSSRFKCQNSSCIGDVQNADKRYWLIILNSFMSIVKSKMNTKSK